MTDILTNQLATAAFRGVTFGVFNEVQDSSGRQIVLHEYVNSSERFIEDLGLLTPTFKIEAFVSGQNFLQRANELENALNLGGFGSLTLPTLGTFTVQALPYTKNASQQAIGEIKYTLEFATGRPAPGPIAAPADVEEVFSLGDKARNIIAEKIEETFNVPVSAENIDVFQNDLIVASNSILEEFQDILPTETNATISRLVDTIARQATSLTQNLDQIGQLFLVKDDVEGIFQSLSLGLTGSAFSQAKSAFTRLIDFTNFGIGNIFQTEDFRGATNGDSNEIPLWPETTQQRIDRNENRVSLANMNQVSALINAYEVGANINYETQAEIDQNRELLEAAHEAIMYDQTSDPNVIQSDSDVRQAVEELRLAALDVLEQKEQQAKTTVDITLPIATSSFVESYLLYSDGIINPEVLENRAQDLRRLNPSQRADGLDGHITIFRTA
jgi:prophage DNA circulation protein